ncbi:PQQ-binding-like beta-propeller repeat protein [Isoptericola sp. b490]|uniref:outer membrane protein assembly factor BamB family protein n=1 Tax=Actinotalea lenta TaxID=3064654 RepID=UPI00271274E9|nr:PQQ-binding-like beta-propeller repeat protein [Isoptericola sp. b490]MDO8121078.1 PQQ-binding-like beta-propeller repeat protein [Isoptericola sp. b490]
MGRGDLVEVALVEDGDRTREGRPRRGHRAVGALVVLLLVGVLLVDGHRAADLAARTAGAVGLNGSLATAPAVAWRAAAGAVLGTSGDLVVLTDPGRTRLRALTAADGAVRWDDPLPMPLASCDLIGSPALVVCSGAATGQGRGTEVVVLATATGKQLRTLRWPGTAAISTWVGDDLVLVGSDDQGAMIARRWSPGDGRTVWSFRSRADVVGPVPTVWDHGTGWARVTSRGRAAVSLATGEAVSPDAPGEALPPAARVVGGWVPAVAPDGADVARSLAGAEVPGRLVAVPATDSTGLDLPLVASDGTLARLGPDARARWRLLTPAWTSVAPAPVLAVDGTLVVAVGDTLLAVDAADGRTLWRAVIGVPGAHAAATDGLVVAHLERALHGLDLVARRPGSGAVVWREHVVDAPSGRLFPGRTLLLATGDQLLALRTT